MVNTILVGVVMTMGGVVDDDDDDDDNGGTDVAGNCGRMAVQRPSWLSSEPAGQLQTYPPT